MRGHTILARACTHTHTPTHPPTSMQGLTVPMEPKIVKNDREEKISFHMKRAQTSKKGSGPNLKSLSPYFGLREKVIHKVSLWIGFFMT